MKQTFLLLLVLSYFLISCSSSSETDDLPIYKRISGEWIIEYKNIEAEDIVIDTVFVSGGANHCYIFGPKFLGTWTDNSFSGNYYWTYSDGTIYNHNVNFNFEDNKLSNGLLSQKTIYKNEKDIRNFTFTGKKFK